MIIDLHNHLGEPAGTRYRQTSDELLRRMDRAGIDLAVVFSFPFGHPDNEYVARAVDEHPDRLTGFVMVSPFAPEAPVKVLERYVERGFRGIKLHPAAHGYKLSELPVCRDILDFARDHELPVIVYSGDELYATPWQVFVAAREYPSVTFVMAHSGFMMLTNDAVMVAERCPNVLLEHSSGISLGVTQSVATLGAHRVVLGSDTPYMDFEVELYKIRASVADTSDQQQILGGNATRLLGMDRTGDTR